MAKNRKNTLTAKLPDSYIKFSFKFYDTRNQQYCISTWKQEDIALVLERLKDISNKTFTEISRHNTYKFHPVKWEETRHKSGFPSNEANELNPFQFALVGVNGQKSRIFGAYADNTFYIVWFDFNHEIHPSPKKNT